MGNTKRTIYRNVYGHFYNYPLALIRSTDSAIEYVETRCNDYKEWSKNVKSFNVICKSYDKCIGAINELGLTDYDVKQIANQAWLDRQSNNGYSWGTKIKIFHRDNRTERNTSSNCGNSNSIRYPRKNRSRRQWSNFYKLFPTLAERDNWDGRTSDKMK